MKKEKPALTYQESFDMYFGGFKGIANKPLPFICLRCKAGVFRIDECFTHIRNVHNESIVSPEFRKRQEEKRKDIVSRIKP